jgi:hypothetical protein
MQPSVTKARSLSRQRFEPLDKPWLLLSTAAIQHARARKTQRPAAPSLAALELGLRGG